MMSTKDAKFSAPPLIKVLRHYLYLAWNNLWRAIQSHHSNTVSTIEKLCRGKVIEELDLATMVHILQPIHLIKHRGRFWMREQKVLKITAFRGNRQKRFCQITIAWNNQHGTEIKPGDKTLYTQKLLIQPIIGEVTRKQDEIGTHPFKLPHRLF